VASDKVSDVQYITSRIQYRIDAAMVQQDTGRFGAASRGKTGIIYVPADLVKDTTFPFVEGDSILIRIDGERLIVERLKKRKD
jgi:hypothetical protein